MKTNPSLFPAAALLLPLFTVVFAGAASAQTITVDIEDASIVDVDLNTATVANLPGPDGHVSFGEAMIASNNTPGRQTVNFAIPTSEWTHLPAFYPGVAVIFGWVPNMSANAEVTIDGTSQTAFTGDTNANGWEVQFLTEFFVEADNCRITGLHGTAVWVDGSFCTVENNSAVSVHLYGGFGGLNSAGNLVKNNSGLGFLHIDQSSNNVVIGNTFRQVRLYGYVAGGFPAVNNRIGGPTLAERNIIVGSGTWNSQGFPGGFALQIVDATNTVVENNQIGTKPDGMSVGHPASIAGILIDGVNNNTLLRNNRVAGVLADVLPPHSPAYKMGTAIRIGGSGSGLKIVGNQIGLNALDQPVLGSATGIEMLHWFNPSGVQNVDIGGSLPGEGNEIAGHVADGIDVAPTFSGVRIQGNSIHDNGALGIDLVTDLFGHGVTPNDALDADTGGNGLQNFPVLTAASISGTGVRVLGTLNSTPASNFTLDFYASPTCDPSGYGEGQTYLGSTTVVTNVSGNAAFDVTLAKSIPNGSFVSGTATAANDSTSELSACVGATGSSSTWTNLGHGLAGTNGTPLYTGTGTLTAGTMLHWTLSSAKNSASAWIVIGFSQINLPFAGGLVVPAPDILLPTATTALGGLALDLFVSSPLPTGQQISTQVWILDPAGVAGWAASNAIAATAP